ncbi:hypothetical protein OS493_035875 [Desmophyllum pertusum]|uniref:Uncharacterized protein n=1 Tax=Desmophyllum pertusum TaxID=174260 RepID=A0A9W9ZZB9_9CNID|nr:hypothetical protein OS493_035875 [Desmophyllum pertusum]
MIKVYLFVLVCVFGCVNSDVVCKTTTWKKVGCFKDLEKGENGKRERALHEQLVNIRDKRSKVYSEPHFDWTRLSESFHSLACRCAEIARNKGYDVFGLQFYGECWSETNGKEIYSKFGMADSKRCVMDYTYDENNNPSGFEHCDISSEQACVGQDSTNYVYILGEGMSLWIIAEVYLQTSDNCEYESDGDARRKF